jgi:ABC-type antimicrobial peptide transport system permease subunit
VKQPVSLLDRFLSAIVGLFIGAVLGMLALYFIMLLSGSDFGLDNVRPGVVLGAAIGFFFGLWRPRRWSWLELLGP